MVKPGAIVRPEGLYQLNVPVTTSGIEPAQCLNQLRHRVPFYLEEGNYKYINFVIRN
jgi:hypothetical protein